MVKSGRIDGMSWSTRELADLAGTTVNTVRHYHRVGLLDEPDRMFNGYKQYQVDHLVRLLQIRRLRDLGVPIEQIGHVGRSDDTSSEALAAIDAELALSIERLQRARDEIGAILRGTSATDLPSGFENVSAGLSTSDRALILIYERLYDQDAMADVRRMLEAERDQATEDFDALAPDADEEERRQLAERYAVTLAKITADYPWLMSSPGAHFSKTTKLAENAVAESVLALYSPAQVDVLARASAIVRESMAQDGEKSE